jgi:hypothetical protein
MEFSPGYEECENCITAHFTTSLNFAGVPLDAKQCGAPAYHQAIGG